MKVILKEDVKKLGRKGEIKEVSEGYARNFLLSKNLAELATESSVRNAKARMEKEAEETKKREEEARKIVSKLQGKKITLKVKDRKGKLFGSIAGKDIAKELAKEGIELDEKSIQMDNSIKKIGNYSVKISLGEGMEAKIGISVESDN